MASLREEKEVLLQSRLSACYLVRVGTILSIPLKNRIKYNILCSSYNKFKEKEILTYFECSDIILMLDKVKSAYPPDMPKADSLRRANQFGQEVEKHNN